MRWPWSKREPEQRSGSVGYTASLVAALQAGAEGSTIESAPLATAALEAASGLYARCMAAAVVQGPPAVQRALSPPVLALMGRNLIRRGEDHHRVYVRRGAIVLEPVGFADAHGSGPDPMTWTYNCTLYGPTDSRHEWVPARSVVHCRYAVDAARPWLGVPPWSWAAATGEAAAALDRMIANEARAPHGHLLGLPGADDDDGDESKLDAFRAALVKAKGKTLIVEDRADWKADDRAGAGSSASRFTTDRFGFPIEAAGPARTDIGRDILGACGVPPTLFVANSDGTAQREAFRRFLHASLRPVARIMETELSAKLDADVTLDLSEIHAADVAGRARSMGTLLKAGVHADDAARATGIELSQPIAAPAPAGPPSDGG